MVLNVLNYFKEIMTHEHLEHIVNRGQTNTTHKDAFFLFQCLHDKFIFFFAFLIRKCDFEYVEKLTYDFAKNYNVMLLVRNID